MIGAKKIGSSDVAQVISRRDWSNGTTFDMYKDDYSSLNTSDSGASSLYGSTFYFRTSANRVYKVISNIPPGEFAAAAFSGSGHLGKHFVVYYWWICLKIYVYYFGFKCN